MKRIALCLALLIMFFPLIGEEHTLSVDQAVEMALENNLSLQMSAIELQGKRRAMNSAWNAFLPSINASVGLTWSDKFLGEPIPTFSMTPQLSSFDPVNGGFDRVEFDVGEMSASTSMQAGLQMSLPINMALGNGIRQLVLDYDAGKMSYEKALREMEVNIRKQFWLIQAMKSGVVLEERNIATLEKRYQQALVNYENGLLPELAVLSAKVSLENSRPSLLKQKMELENMINLFKFLVGIPQEDDLVMTGELTVEMQSFSTEELIGSHLSNRMDVQAINHQLLSLRNTKTLSALYSLTPTLNFGVTWGTQVQDEPFNSDSWDPFYDNLSISATLLLPLDGFIPGSKKANDIRAIQDGIDTLELTRQLTYENAAIEISNLVRKLETSETSLDALAYTVELAEKNFRLNSEAYDLGTVELLEVESAQDQLFQAKYAVLFETFNYLSALLDLELALNSRLEEM